MAISLFGTASNPADNGTTATKPLVITPPGSMAANDYVVLIGQNRADTSTLAMSEAGGQTWTSETLNAQTLKCTRVFHCRFDGTWDADPSISCGGTAAITGVMLVFRGVDTTTAIDVTEARGVIAAPSTPFDVVASAISTNTDNAVAVFVYGSADDNTWTVQTAGWTHAGSNQYRNLSGSDQSLSIVYKTIATAGTTGSVTNRQTANGGDATNYHTLALKPAPSNVVVTPGVVALTLTRRVPTVSTPVTVTPGIRAITLTRHTPIVTALAGVTVTPGIRAITLTRHVPIVTALAPVTVTPGIRAITLTRHVPTVSTPVRLTPGIRAITLTRHVPTVAVTAHVTVTPGPRAITLTRHVPTVTAYAGVTVVPGPASLTLTRHTPTVTAGGSVVATPGIVTLTLTRRVPVVTAYASITVTPGPRALTLTAFAPNVVLTDQRIVTPGPASLTLTPYAPIIRTGQLGKIRAAIVPDAQGGGISSPQDAGTIATGMQGGSISVPRHSGSIVGNPIGGSVE